MPSSIHWPAALPPPLRTQHGDTPRSAALTRQWAAGTRCREIYSDSRSELQLLFRFTAPQWAYFRAWYRYTLRNGTLWFWLPVTVAGVSEEREVNFNGISIPDQLVGVNHGRLSATVETRKGTQMDRDTFDVIEEIGSVDGYAGLLQALELFVNQDGLAPME